MPYNNVSYELLISLLDGIDIFKGVHANQTALETAFPEGQVGWFAVVTATNSPWAWNTETEEWSNLNAPVTEYTSMTDAEKAGVLPNRYLVVPDPVTP